MTEKKISVKIDGDSSSAVKAVTDLDKSAEELDQSLEKVSVESTNAASDLENLGGEAQQANAETKELGNSASTAAEDVKNLGTAAESTAESISDLNGAAESVDKALDNITAESTEAAGDLAALGDAATQAATGVDNLGKSTADVTVQDLGKQAHQASEDAEELGKSLDDLGRDADQATREIDGLRQAIDVKTKAISAGLQVTRSEIEIQRQHLAAARTEQLARQAAAKAQGDEAAATRAGNALRQIEAEQMALVARAKRAEATAVAQVTEARRQALAAIGPLTHAQSQELIAAENHARALRVEAAAADQAEKHVRALAATHRENAAAVTDADRSTQQYTGSLTQIAGLIGGAFAIDKLVDYGKSLNAVADQYKDLEAKIGLAVGRQTELRGAVEDVGRVALASYSNLEATASLYGRMAASAKELGISNAEALALTQTINRSIQVSGASAQASTAAIQQLVQALQSGVLRGDEFNSIMEQGPRLAKALADGLGVPIGALRSMAEEGELTSARVVNALKGQTDVINAEFERLPLTTGRAIENLSTQWTLFIGQLSGGAQATSWIAEGINKLAENLQTVADVATRAGMVLTAALAVQGVKALRAFTVEMIATGKAADMLSLSLSKVPKVISITVAVTGFEVGWQLGSMLEENSALARKLGVGITSFFQQIINDLQFVKEAAAAVFTDDTVNAAFDRYIERNKEIGRITSEMMADAEKGSFKAAQAADTAATSVEQLGTKGTATGQALAAAGTVGAAGVGQVTKAAESARAALTAMAAAIAQPAPTTASINEIAQAIATAVNQGKNLEQQLGVQLPAAIENLSGRELVKFRADFVNSMQQAKQALQDAIETKKPQAEIDALRSKIGLLEQATRAGLMSIAEQAAKNLGVDVPAAFGKISEGYAKARDDLSLLIRQLPELKAAGVDTATVLAQAFAKMIDGAKNKEELDDIKRRVELLRAELGEGVTDGLLEQAAKQAEKLTQALEDGTPGIQSVKEAMRELGVVSDQALKEMAAKARAAFEVIRDSGTATPREINEAWKVMAEAAIAANNGVADASIKAQASQHGFVVETDKAGKAIVKSMQEAAEATRDVGKAAKEAGEDAAEGAAAASRESDRWVRDAAGNIETMTVSWLSAEAAASQYGKQVADIVRANNQGRFILDIIDKLREQTDAGVRALESLDRAQQRLQSNGARSVDDLRLRLLELNGTEEQIAEARQRREMAEIERQRELTKLQQAKARKLGNDDEAEALGYELEMLDEQLKLMERIHREEDKQRQAAAAEAKRKQREQEREEQLRKQEGAEPTNAPSGGGSGGTGGTAPIYQSVINLQGLPPVRAQFSSAEEQSAAEQLIRQLHGAAGAAS